MPLSKKQVDETLKDIRKMTGVTSYTIWRDRLKIISYDVIGMMLVWCVYSGIVSMGLNTFIISLLSFIVFEIVVFTIRHIYYGIKIRKKHLKGDK